MARCNWSDGHYADVECAYAELERYVVLNLRTRGSPRRYARALLQIRSPAGLKWMTPLNMLQSAGFRERNRMRSRRYYQDD